MTRFKLSPSLGLSLGSFALALLAALPGCTDRKPSNDDAGETDPSTSNVTTGSSDPTVPTEGGTTAQDVTTDPGSASQSGSSEPDPTTSVGTTVTTAEPACADVEGQPNDSTCTDASGCGCASGKCFIVPAIGGFCGECTEDADCAASGGGCTVPNPIAMKGSTCNMGEAGAGCETDEICATEEAPACGLLLEVPGIIQVSTCGACASNEDCIAVNEKTPNCTPTYDVEKFSGQFVCVENASVANNDGCNHKKDGQGNVLGDAACESGFCGEANVMGLVKLGICGECRSNADCVKIGKQTCSDPSVDLNAAALQGSVCN